MPVAPVGIMPAPRLASMVALAIAGTPALVAAHPLDDLPAGHWLEVPDSHLRDVAASPDEFPWVGQGEGISGIVNDWCSGAYDTTRDRLYIGPCGGHNGYYGNEVYAFDVEALAWMRLNDPRPIVTTECPEPSMFPCALHTYDGLEYLPAPVDGLLQIGGWEGPMTYLMDPDAATWTVYPDWGQGRTGDIAAWDPVTEMLWAHSCAYAGTGKLSHWDPSTGEWTVRTEYTELPYYHTAAVDPVRRLFVAVGGGNVLTWTLAPVGEDVVMTALETSGDTALVEVGNPGLEYDPEIDRMVAWHGGGDVYTLDLDASAWELRPPAADNTVVPGAANANGTYGRFRYVPSCNAYVVVSSVDENVFFYKLSDAPGPGPGDTDDGGDASTGADDDDGASTNAADETTAGADDDGATAPSDDAAPADSSSTDPGATTDDGDGCSCTSPRRPAHATALVVFVMTVLRRRSPRPRR
jgi:hypothetical protein